MATSPPAGSLPFQEAPPALRERAFSLLFESVRDAIVVADPQGRIVGWNRAAEGLFGWTAAEVHGEPVEILVPSRMLAMHRTGMARYMRTGEGRRIDSGDVMSLPALRKDGTEIRVELTLAPLDVPRLGRHAIAVLRDVTETHRAVRERDRLASLVNASIVPVISFDGRGCVRSWNPAAEELFGWPQEEVAGHPVPFSDDAWWRSLVATAERGDAVRRVTGELPTAEGGKAQVEATIFPLAPESPTDPAFAACLEDAGDRNRTRRALKLSRDRFRALAESSRDIISFHTLDGTATYVSPAVYAVLGYSAEEVEPVTPFALVHPDDGPSLREALARVARQGEAVVLFRAKRADGTYAWLEAAARLVSTPEHEPTIVSVLRDVTRRMQAEATLTEERRQLASTNEWLEAFSYMVSHDLKEPLRAVEAYLRAIQEDHREVLPADARGLLDDAASANGRMRSLLEGLLEFSRAARADLRIESVDPAAVLAGDVARARLDGLMRERRVRLVVAPSIPEVMATPAALAQVLGNLVTNAIRHNPSDAPWVGVSGERVDDHVEIRVDDDGPGFPPDVLRRFNAREIQGARALGGFGLLIARRAVERLGGSISLENRADGGARARVRLAAAPGDVGARTRTD